jgi:hypothetical protein
MLVTDRPPPGNVKVKEDNRTVFPPIFGVSQVAEPEKLPAGMTPKLDEKMPLNVRLTIDP